MTEEEAVPEQGALIEPAGFSARDIARFFNPVTFRQLSADVEESCSLCSAPLRTQERAFVWEGRRDRTQRLLICPRCCRMVAALV
jgi:hypothetical protein